MAYQGNVDLNKVTMTSNKGGKLKVTLALAPGMHLVYIIPGKFSVGAYSTSLK